MLRSEPRKVPEGVRMITIFSFLAGFYLVSQGVSIFSSNSPENFAMMIDGIVSIIIGVGFTLAAKWAWTLRVILSIVLIIEATLMLILLLIEGTLLSLSENSEDIVFAIGALIINPLILYYLYRPHVKIYFGKVTPTGYLR
jgi:hypothetical protein